MFGGRFLKPGGTRDRHDRLTYTVEKDRVPDPMDPMTDDGVFWPEGFKFAAWSSHDIDRFYNPKQRVYQSFEHFKRRNLRRSIVSLLGPDRTGIGDIVKLDLRLGIPSTFFLMAEEYHHDVDAVKNALGQDFEFGLHASYDSHMSREKLLEEKRKLEEATGIENIPGVRHHYLRFRRPDTWENQKGIFKYDSTFSWPDHIGYRGGRANPFFTDYEIWEIPLAVMDVTVFNVQKVGWREVRRLVDKVCEVRGLFSYLWHNESLTDISATRPWRSFYVKLTRYLRKKGAWFATGKEIVEWAEDNWK